MTVVSNFLIPVENANGFQSFPDLSDAYQYLFEQLYVSIKNGLVLDCNAVAPTHIEIPRVAVRTRNFKNKATAHNSDFSQTLEIVNQILDTNALVTNYGAPPLSLLDIIDDERYSEKFLPSIDDELHSIKDKVVLRADAGLFVLYACTNLQLCTITSEWSDFLGIKLMEARNLRDGTESRDFEFPKFENEKAFKNWLNH